ncbi:malate synthase-like isoform X2 [Dunckerocampus dactyliophorus]|uniref:malate synthase-like isoform X2 n=1 Tax=Dunckerocampus dactyliophorus TaxID=161453 RepID=UPI0024067622|nr:malate synthase-like isoform X2 [Dunckerocampus dactyliophorus]
MTATYRTECGRVVWRNRVKKKFCRLSRPRKTRLKQDCRLGIHFRIRPCADLAVMMFQKHVARQSSSSISTQPTTSAFSMSETVSVEICPPPAGLEAMYERLFTPDCLHFLYDLISTFDEAVDQVDFDDGNCPTFYNQIKGIHNVLTAVHNAFPDAPHISQAPVLMIRPRAWNMVEHNMMVKGKEVPGPLFDFGLVMFHCGKTLFESKSGPFFYLSKVESFLEARLWNNIFVWAQNKLLLPQGSIKATVLIENVLAAFEMEEILYELREHSAGLNCGLWDYSASFVNKFGHRRAFLLPDRSKYVNMEKRFLRSYMDLLVQTCHRRSALATGGMAALLLPEDPHSESYRTVMATVSRLKLLEIEAGVDGFMVYDQNLIQPMQELFQIHTEGDNQLDKLVNHVRVTSKDLLTMPGGGVTLYGLKHNIAVGVLFIHAWLCGKGHFYYRGQVEDSATAEISRSQVWQWIRHQAQLEDEEKLVSRKLVTDITREVMMELCLNCSARVKLRFQTAADMFLEVVLRRDFPEFITSFLNQDHTFLSSQDTQQAEDLNSDVHRAKF